MPSSAIIDLAIGLIFVFGVTAALASVFTELVSRFIGLRGAYLLTGLRELVDSGETSTDLGKAEKDYEDIQGMMRHGAASRTRHPAAAATAPAARTAPAAKAEPAAQAEPAQAEETAQTEQATPSITGALLGGPILSSQGMVGQINDRNLTINAAARAGRLHKMTADHQRRGVWRQRRSLPSYVSAESFAEAVIDLVVPDAAGQTTMAAIQRNVGALPDALPFKSALQALVKNAGGDVSRFQNSVERWYDDHMSRVSGWYKRHVALITLAVGAILIVLLNINGLTIGRTLYSQNAVSTAVSAVAAKGTSCPASQDPQECLSRLQAQLSAFWQFVLVLLGIYLMIIAIVPGAQFRFGLLRKIGSIRSTGPTPAGAGG